MKIIIEPVRAKTNAVNFSAIIYLLADSILNTVGISKIKNAKALAEVIFSWDWSPTSNTLVQVSCINNRGADILSALKENM